MSPHSRTVIVVSLFLTASVYGQDSDAKKIRDLIEFPPVTFSFNFGFGFDFDQANKGSFGKRKEPEQKDVKGEIAKLEKALCGDAGDVQRYCDLSDLYEDEKKAQDAASRAVKLARELLAKDAGNAKWKLQLANALATAKDLAGAEKLCRQVVRDAPQNSEGWEALGWLLLRRVVDELELYRPPGSKASELEFLVAVPQTQVALFRKRLSEAEACMGEVVRLTPRQSRAYMERHCVRYYQGFFDEIKCIIDLASRDQASTRKRIYSAGSVDDLFKAAELSPDEPLLSAQAVFYAAAHYGKEAPTSMQGEPPAKYFPEEIKKTVARIEQHLDELSKHQDRILRSEALYARALVELFSRGIDRPKIEPWLEQALALHADYEAGWHMLVANLMLRKQYSKLASVCEDRLRIKDDAHFRYYAAHAEFHLGRLAEAERHLTGASRLAPNALEHRLGLAAVLLKKGDQKSLAEAGRVLANLDDARYSEQANPGRTGDEEFLLAVHRALTGDVDRARSLLKSRK